MSSFILFRFLVFVCTMCRHIYLGVHNKNLEHLCSQDFLCRSHAHSLLSDCMMSAEEASTGLSCCPVPLWLPLSVMSKPRLGFSSQTESPSPGAFSFPLLSCSVSDGIRVSVLSLAVLVRGTAVL